jgi:hypothetical protein
MTEATATAPSPSASPPDFDLPQFAEDGRPLLHEGRHGSSIDLTNADFSLDVDNQFRCTPVSFKPSMPKESQPDTGTYDQKSLMRLQNPSHVGFEDAEYQSGVISNYDFDESFPMPSVYPDTCTTSFQVTQLLEVAKHKEHAAQLLQEAAKCREYTVRSLLATQSAWGVPPYPYNFNQDLWGLQDTTVLNTASSIQTPLPVI